MGDLEELTALVRGFIDERDWSRFHNAKDLSAAISIEASELQEAFLWKDRGEAEAMMSDPETCGRVEEEMADILIYLLSMASTYGIDLRDAVERKVAGNERRYPADVVRGKALKYTEIVEGQ